MGDVARGGRTIIFVSHQMNQIRRLCTNCIWLEEGKVRLVGPTPMVVGAYEGASQRGAHQSNVARSTRSKSHFTAWEVMNPASAEPHALCDPGPASIKFTFEATRPLRSCFQGIALYNSQNQLIWGNGVNHFDLAAGSHEFHYGFEMVPLQPGLYHWLVTL